MLCGSPSARAVRSRSTLERLPLASRLAEVGPEPFWTMGEDYELLAALAPEDASRLGYPVVGSCVAGSGVVFRRGGEPLEWPAGTTFGRSRRQR